MRRSQCALTIASLLVALLPAAGCQRMGRQHPLGEGVADVPPVDPGGGDGGIGPGGPPDGGDGGGGGGGGGGNQDGDDLQAPVPEPATLMLLGGGIAGVALLRRKRRNR